MVGGGGLPTSAARSHELKGTVRGPPWLRVPLLASGALGIQTVWSVEMAFATPYLIQLGLSKSMVAATFVAGPLSGLLVQPAIGVISDHSTHQMGRRRPMLAVACLICSASMLLLGFARGVAGLFGAENDSWLPKLLAVISIFGIDFSVNAVSALNRALVIDLLPATNEAQSHGNAWVSRLAGVGSIASFFLGNLDLPHSAPFRWFSLFAVKDSGTGSHGGEEGMAGSEAQLRCLSALTVFVLLFTNALVAWAAQEIQMNIDALHHTSTRGHSRGQLSTLLHSSVFMVRELLAESRRLHPAIKDLLRIQFFAQIGWFPVLFYSTVWIGNIYKTAAASAPASSTGDMDLAATREGSFAMFWHAVVVLLASIALPAALSASTASRSSSSDLLDRFLAYCPDLAGMWAASHFVFAGAMLLTWPTAWWGSMRLAFFVIALTGLPWAVNVWAPYTMIGVLLNGSDSQHEEPQQSGQAMSSPERAGLLSARRSAELEGQAGIAGIADGRKSSDTDDLIEEQLRLHHSQSPAFPSAGSHGLPTTGTDKAATVLGIHNVAIVLPQFVVTIISSLVFAILEPNIQAVPSHGTAPPAEHPSGPSLDTRSYAGSSDAVGVVLRIGGLSAIIAGILTVRFRARYLALLRGERLP